MEQEAEHEADDMQEKEQGGSMSEGSRSEEQQGDGGKSGGNSGEDED